MGITNQTASRRVFSRVITLIGAAGVTAALALGIAFPQPAVAVSVSTTKGGTSAAQSTVATVAVARSSASNPWGVTASKTWAFTQCIFAVGVPIGLVAAIATNPLVWAYVLGFRAQPNIGGSIGRYLSFVKSRCGYALR